MRRLRLAHIGETIAFTEPTPVAGNRLRKGVDTFALQRRQRQHRSWPAARAMICHAEHGESIGAGALGGLAEIALGDDDDMRDLDDARLHELQAVAPPPLPAHPDGVAVTVNLALRL